MTRRGIVLAAAVALLDISLAFQNVWPTPLIRWSGEFSVELGAFGRIQRRRLRCRRGGCEDRKEQGGQETEDDTTHGR